MKILLVAHGFPPEQVGGVELHTQELAFALAARGHAVLVVAGTVRPSSPPHATEVRRETVAGPDGQHVAVARIARGDLYFDHWHKSLDAGVSRAFRDLLREFAPDVVHVQHWLRLSRDLVAVAARERVPSVVTLHDAWVSCPIAFRVRPDTRKACDALVGPHPCVACAGKVPPRTPWVPQEAAYMLLAERQRDIGRELERARVLIAPSRAHARAIERWLGKEDGSLAAEIVAPCAALPPRVHRFESALAEPPPALLHLVAWGQIARHKGLELLIEAFQDASSKLERETLLFLDVHGGPAEPDFADRLRAATRGIPGVSWRGPFAPDDLRRAIDPKAQVFVSASRAHESYGVSASEAARLGLGLLLPDAPAFLERFPFAAEFYASGDARALSDAIVRLARRPARVDAARNAAIAHAARLAPSALKADRHVELYARAVAAGAPAVAPASWFDARMATEATQAWDRALSSRTAAELGLEREAP